MNVELFDPAGEEIWFWETSGEQGYMQDNPLVPAGGSGTYTFNAAIDDISVSCEATVNIDETLELVNAVKVELIDDGEFQITWEPVNGADEYSLDPVFDSNNQNSMGTSIDIIDIGEDSVVATLRLHGPDTTFSKVRVSAFSKPLSYIDVETGEEYVTPGIYELNGSISELEVTLK